MDEENTPLHDTPETDPGVDDYGEEVEMRDFILSHFHLSSIHDEVGSPPLSLLLQGSISLCF